MIWLIKKKKNDEVINAYMSGGGGLFVRLCQKRHISDFFSKKVKDKKIINKIK